MLQLGKLEAGMIFMSAYRPMRHLMKALSTTARGCSVTPTPTRRPHDTTGLGYGLCFFCRGACFGALIATIRIPGT